MSADLDVTAVFMEIQEELNSAAKDAESIKKHFLYCANLIDESFKRLDEEVGSH